MSDQPELLFRENADVFSADGSKLGSVHRLVIDPSAGAVSHIVVSKGHIFTEERVVPVDIVAQSNEKAVRLQSSVELDDLPKYEVDHYIQADDTTASGAGGAGLGSPLIFGYPAYSAAPPLGGAYGVSPPAGAPAYPVYPPSAIKTVRRNVPRGSAVVDTGTAVRTMDGQKVGKVTQVTVDDGELVSVTVDPGWFRDEQTVPAHFIRSIDEDELELGVTGDTLRQLER